MKLTPETIDHPRYTSRYFVQGNGFKRLERYLVLKLDGQDVWIQSEQRLLDRYGVVVFTPNPDDPDDEHYLRYPGPRDPRYAPGGGRRHSRSSDSAVLHALLQRPTNQPLEGRTQVMSVAK